MIFWNHIPNLETKLNQMRTKSPFHFFLSTPYLWFLEDWIFIWIFYDLTKSKEGSTDGLLLTRPTVHLDGGGSTPFQNDKIYFSVVYSRPNTEAFINSVLPFNSRVIPHMNTNLFVEIGVVGPKFLPLDNQVIQRPIASPSSHYDWLRLLVSWSWNFEINLRHITRTKCLWLHMLNYGQWPS